MENFNSNNRGQSLIGLIIVLVVVGVITGGLYLYFSQQFPEMSEIIEKPAKEKPPEERRVSIREIVSSRIGIPKISNA